jgi:hypothetical protein
MARLSPRDRFFTPPVARAITSPLAILLAGAGAAVGILTGLGLPAAAGLAVAAWAGRVIAAVPRNPSAERIDPFTLGEPWRRFVQDALQAEARFHDAVGRAEAGPLRDRLTEIDERIDTGVRECWRIARRGQALVEARRSIDTAEAQQQLSSIEQGAGERWAAGSALERTADSLRAQLATAARMDEVILDAHSRLRLLNARLDEVVARTLELSVETGAGAALSGLGADVDTLVGDMEALRQALEETDDAEASPGAA